MLKATEDILRKSDQKCIRGIMIRAPFLELHNCKMFFCLRLEWWLYLIKYWLWSNDCGNWFWCFDWLQKTKQRQKKNMNWLFITTTDVLSNQIFLAYIFEFENVPSSLSFRWHLFLGGRSFVFGASQSCRPPVNLLLGLRGDIADNNQLLPILRNVLIDQKHMIRVIIKLFHLWTWRMKQK